ncbi:transcription factor bHLH94-like [Vigna unguiculata]|uniref:Transcription factor MYC2 n=1 Tax=Vigna unguiculata TaxID=3917 RepID=A0A4D6NTE1_VIGUN|nr:transcription factor bHLH94-like [Vigna unguiculata]QCE15914.1 transcription factor MYC2 [Vigna unguiculata]
MALEAVVFPQDPFPYACKDYFYSPVGAAPNYGFQAAEEEKLLLGIINNNIEDNLYTTWDSSSTSVLQNVKEQWDSHSSPEACTVDESMIPPLSSSAEATATATTTTTRRKRRRTKSAKNKEEIENQRMTHIAVERNRRKQMNEYLAVLRSLMPSSYVQRGDQASIIGGAINFVKELEQVLQSMEGEKRRKQGEEENVGLNGWTTPFAEFFTFPQYTTRGTQKQEQKQWAVADIEVTMVDSHANLKILAKKQPSHLIKIVLGLQSLRLTILHLNVTTLHHMVLYSISVKVEEGCELNTVDEIAAAVNQLLGTIQDVAFS